MDHIETKILNSYTIQKAAQNMVFAARLAGNGQAVLQRVAFIQPQTIRSR